MLRSLRWALFLACSWTWCIGMFLPVLFVRNWGIWAWVVFAIPNIVGAAAMGFVIRSRETSQRILIDHQPAVALFSLITIAYHIYFIYWFVGNRLTGPWSLIIPVAAFFIFWSIGRRQPERDPKLSAIVWLISIAAFIAFLLLDGYKPKLLPARWPSYEVLWLVPVCIFGFALCPYLDATFHRAHMATGPRAPLVFSLGFGLFFLLMILFTLWYVRPMAARIHLDPSIPTTLLYLVGCHMSIQSALTVSLHVRELERMTMTPRFRFSLISVLFIAALLAGIVTKVDLQSFIGLDGGEAGYWLFMGFYSIFFPAYVYLLIIPGKAPDRSLSSPRRLIILAALLLFVTALFWIAIHHRQMPLLAMGIVMLLLARLIPAKKTISPVPAAQEIR